MRRLRAFGAFWYDFVIGDDWRGAAVVASAIAGTAALVAAGVNAWWLLPVSALGRARLVAAAGHGQARPDGQACPRALTRPVS